MSTEHICPICLEIVKCVVDDEKMLVPSHTTDANNDKRVRRRQLPITVLPCSHILHKNCYSTLRKKGFSDCPLCRTGIPSNDEPDCKIVLLNKVDNQFYNLILLAIALFLFLLIVIIVHNWKRIRQFFLASPTDDIAAN